MIIYLLPTTALAADTHITIELSDAGYPLYSWGPSWSYDEDEQELTIDFGYILDGFSMYGESGDFVYMGEVVNKGMIAGGCFNGQIVQNVVPSYITGGVFLSTSLINRGTISGGTFLSTVDNHNIISGGRFAEMPTLNVSATFRGMVVRIQQLSAVSRGDATALLNSLQPETRSMLKFGGLDLQGETYEISANGGLTGKGLIGLYLNEEPKTNSDGKYYIDTAAFTPYLGGTAYQFNMPAVDTTVYAVFYVPVRSISNVPATMAKNTSLTFSGTTSPENTTYHDVIWSVKNANGTGAEVTESGGAYTFRATTVGTATVTATIANGATKDTAYTKDFDIVVTDSAVSPITIGGAIESTFNFEKGATGQEYTFTVDDQPESLESYKWSVKGTLPAGLSLMDADKASAYIGGTPTEVTTEPVSLTVSVDAIRNSGSSYEGSVDILIAVNEPYNPFTAAASLLKNASCAVPMGTANTKETISAWLKDTWLSGIAGLNAALGEESNLSELSVVVNNDFTAAIVGNAANPSGTNGGVTFSVLYGDATVCDNLVCTIEATAYNHTHSFSTEHSHDDTYHWHECTDPSCDAVSGKAAHSCKDDGDCTTAVKCVCGYIVVPASTHEFFGAYASDEVGHWHTCTYTGCAATDTIEPHSGGVAIANERARCSICGEYYGTVQAPDLAPEITIKVGAQICNSEGGQIKKRYFKGDNLLTLVAVTRSLSGIKATYYYITDRTVADPSKNRLDIV